MLYEAILEISSCCHSAEEVKDLPLCLAHFNPLKYQLGFRSIVN